MTKVMMILGGFPFMLPTVPYQTLARSSGWNWPEQELIGTSPAMQYTGKQAETIELAGMLVPPLTGDRSSLELLRVMADFGKPLVLISGQGLFMGMWVITGLKEDQDTHFSDGMPRKMTFTLSLKKYADSIGPKTGAFARASRIASILG